ncbi:MAG: ATP-binding protein [Fibrella sp.]|nr:ATP-binding protein [Armatimonadota bacterium]
MKVLSLGALYGANASGKSNLLKAIQTLRELVTKGVAPDELIPVDRFLLGDRSAMHRDPTFFEIHFIVSEEMYCYGLECDDRYIRREWLRYTMEDKPLFDRYMGVSGKAIIENYEELTNRSETKAERLQFVAEGTRPNQPFLTQANEQNVQGVQEIINWFRFLLEIFDPGSSLRPHMRGRLSTPMEDFDQLGIFLNRIDTGISKVETYFTDFDLDQLPAHVRHAVEGFFLRQDAFVMDVPLDGENITLSKDATGKIARQHIRARHSDGTNDGILLDWSNESDGTQRTTELWQMIFTGISPDRVLLIDELDRSLHPELTRALIQAWRQSAPAGNQLIFTTHNDNFLEDDLLRRDEVWFVSKDKTGASRMVSETQFKPVEGVTRQRAYLDGMYGGTPRIPSRGFYSVSRDSQEADK